MMIELSTCTELFATIVIPSAILLICCYLFHVRPALGLKWEDLVPQWESVIPEHSGPLQQSRKKHYINYGGSSQLVIMTVGCTSAEPLFSALEGTGSGDDATRRDARPVDQDKLVTSEVRIPKKYVGLFIGKCGYNIKKLQKESGAVMFLNDHVFDNGDRLCIMRGSEDNVSLAKTLVSKFLESAPDILCKEVLIPKQCVGRVIGHDGKIIRSIEEKSKATVFVDLKRIERQSDGTEEYRFAVIKGTKEQVEVAEELVLRHSQEFTKVRNPVGSEHTGGSRTKTQVLLPSRGICSVSNYQDIISRGDAEFMRQLNLTLNGKLEVFVSCVYNPNLFWIQIIGKESLELRRLSDAMTDYYYHKCRHRAGEMDRNYREGDIVAAPFHWNGKMYRARVLHVHGDKTIEIEYVDYGDRRSVKSHMIRPLVMDFMKPKFQAIQASLNLLCPEGSWPEDMIIHFCDISHCAKWKSLTAKIKGFVTDVENKRIARIHLELMDKEKNVGEELLGNAVNRKLFINGLKKENQLQQKQQQKMRQQQQHHHERISR